MKKSTKNIPSECNTASIGTKHAMILLHDANPRSDGIFGKDRGQLVRCRRPATVHLDDSLAHTRHAPAARRRTGCRGRILIAEAPVGYQQPRAAAGTEPEFGRSLRFRSWITV